MSIFNIWQYLESLINYTCWKKMYNHYECCLLSMVYCGIKYIDPYLVRNCWCYLILAKDLWIISCICYIDKIIWIVFWACFLTILKILPRYIGDNFFKKLFTVNCPIGDQTGVTWKLVPISQLKPKVS